MYLSSRDLWGFRYLIAVFVEKVLLVLLLFCLTSLENLNEPASKIPLWTELFRLIGAPGVQQEVEGFKI